MLARRFLGCITILTLLAVAGAFLMYQFGDRVLETMATPKGHFEAPAETAGSADYAADDRWLAKPGKSTLSDWTPDTLSTPLAAPAPSTPAATFYIHPTTYLQTDRWNAPLEPGGETEARTALFVRHQASSFASIGSVWAPRYRQAAFGAFLLRNEDARKALEFAYGDVQRAFDAFLAANPGGPIVLAAHSQGSLHLLRLLAERGPALKDRLVAAYVVGWPVGIEADLPKTGLPPCRTPTDTRCVLSWQSFSDPANPALVLNAWVGTKGLTGMPRRREDMLCTDPVSGTLGGQSAAADNPGTLVPDDNFSHATATAGQVGAACRNGLLLADGNIPKLGAFALPGNNLHPYDYALYWGAVRRDVERRLAAFEAGR